MSKTTISVNKTSAEIEEAANNLLYCLEAYLLARQSGNFQLVDLVRCEFRKAIKELLVK